MPRRIQFSVRKLLVFALCAACFFAGISFERERIRRKDKALLEEVEAISEEYARRNARYTRLVREEYRREAEALADVVTQTEPEAQ